MKLPRKLRMLREEAGITQQQLRDKTGLGIQTIRNYESDSMEKFPNTYQLKLLCDFYGVTYEYLLNENCNNKTPEAVEIGKILKLSDTSLDRIKDLQNHDLQYFPDEGLYYREDVHGEEAFDKWLSSFDELKRFSVRLEILYTLNKIMETSKYFINISKCEDAIEHSYNTDKVFVKKLNTLLSKKLEEYNECFNTPLEGDFMIDNYTSLNNYFSEYLNRLNAHKKIIPGTLFGELDDLETAASIIYEDTFKNIKYCQYEILEIIKNCISKQSATFEKDFIPSEIETLLNQIDNGGNKKNERDGINKK